MHDDPHLTSRPRPVDNTDWLKTAAIILVVVDHTGYFFIENPDWWQTFGRFAAPIFFFLLGFAQTRTIPLYWIALGIFLTLLDSWNNNWAWMAPNILLSFAFIRAVRPYVKTALQRHGWVALILIACALVAVLPLTVDVVDYGAEGWLWALFGLCQRMYVDGKLDIAMKGPVSSLAAPAPAVALDIGLMRFLTCLVTAVVYVWQEQKDFMFPEPHLAVFILGTALLSVSLCLFLRGPSSVQPPEPFASGLRYLGRHTLEIYAIQLAGYELVIKMVPSLAP